MADEAAQQAWIKRVLGTEFPVRAAAKQVTPLMPIWARRQGRRSTRGSASCRTRCAPRTTRTCR